MLTPKEILALNLILILTLIVAVDQFLMESFNSGIWWKYHSEECDTTATFAQGLNRAHIFLDLGTSCLGKKVQRTKWILHWKCGRFCKILARTSFLNKALGVVWCLATCPLEGSTFVMLSCLLRRMLFTSLKDTGTLLWKSYRLGAIYQELIDEVEELSQGW